MITYPALPSLGSSIPYEIYDGTTLVQSLSVNQQLPCDDAQLDSHTWERIAVMPFTYVTADLP